MKRASFVSALIANGHGDSLVCDCCGQGNPKWRLSEWHYLKYERKLSVCLACLRHDGMISDLKRQGFVRV